MDVVLQCVNGMFIGGDHMYASLAPVTLCSWLYHHVSFLQASELTRTLVRLLLTASS